MKSMTGFGRATCTIGGSSYRLELRTLNSRFLDLKLRVPWKDGEVESKSLGLVRQRLARGRVELSVWEQASPAASALRLDQDVARKLAAALDELTAICDCDRQTAARLLPPVPELLAARASALSSDEIWAPLSLGLQAALDQLVEMREREGRALRDDIEGHVKRLSELVAEVERTVADEPDRLSKRLEQKLGQLTTAALDPTRMAQEVAILVDRSDVSEEIARLKSHFSELRHMLQREEPAGRALEFMLQELNRELNTIASKTNAVSVTTAIIEAKGVVEKMREQVQNVE
jgi:uncharacterized protein (TIGR00255 family)